MRVELPDVFEATHRLLVDLNHRGIVEGYRIDHPDGLADPAGYVDRLRAALRPGTAIWVEKILEGDEVLPDWACEGTTGYDAAKVVSYALADPAIAPALQHAWEETGGEPSLEEVDPRLEAAGRGRRPRSPSGTGWSGGPARRCPRPTRPGSRRPSSSCSWRARSTAPTSAPARTWTTSRSNVSRSAGHRAGSVRPDLKTELEQLVELATGRGRDAGSEAGRDFAVRLQQTWGPVMAKGIEDTAFYRWHRQVGLNEVGGDPDLLDEASPDLMHRWALHQQRAGRWA